MTDMNGENSSVSMLYMELIEKGDVYDLGLSTNSQRIDDNDRERGERARESAGEGEGETDRQINRHMISNEQTSHSHFYRLLRHTILQQ